MQKPRLSTAKRREPPPGLSLRSGAGTGEVRVTVSAEGVEPAVLTLRAV